MLVNAFVRKEQDSIRDFTEKYGLSSSLAYRLELCCEELIYEMISGCFDDGRNVDIDLGISYSEADGSTVIELTCAGRNFNPFNAPEDDDVHLGVTMLKKISHGRITHNYSEDINTINIIL